MHRISAVAGAIGGAIVIALLAIGLMPREGRTTIDLDDRAPDTKAGLRRRSSISTPIRFGFDRRSTPQEDARQYLPLLDYLHRATGYRFELRFTPKGKSIVDELGNGHVQFAAIGAGSYIQARREYGVIPISRGLNSEGKAEYRSAIVVRTDSELRSIDQLRGKRFAFGNRTSTQGHLIPRITLAQHGLLLNDLAGHAYTGSHRDCADAVISGAFDAGGLQDTMAEHLAGTEVLRILFTSDYYPSSGIAVNRSIPAEIRERVTRALLDFQPMGRDAKDLYRWERTEMPNGFVAASHDDYAPLLRWTQQFGLLESAETK